MMQSEDINEIYWGDIDISRINNAFDNDCKQEESVQRSSESGSQKWKTCHKNHGVKSNNIKIT